MELTSGDLMPVSALPGPGGIGGFGQAAYRFVDFLHTCKQHYWQILPLTTTSYGDSPYQSFSARAGNPERIGYHRMTQYLFARQWSALKEYANARGVLIIGGMPIYVSRDSVEMWSEPELFKTAPDGSPASVAGTPPDNFSATGQYWGNPIYDWGAMAADGYSWWKGRMRAALTMYDLVRLDHFRGFEAYWEVPFGSPDSSYGSWTQGPGMAFFDELKRDLGELPLIAEDLGFLTPGVIAMRDGTGFPGMKILQFAFDGGGNSYYLPHNYTRNTIAYVGTHDNETARGWFEDTATPRVREQALEYLRPAAGETIADALNRAIAASVSDTCIYTMQDLLGLGNEARTNTPATVGGNWAWRMREGDLTRAVERKLTSWTETYFRVPGKGDVILPD